MIVGKLVLDRTLADLNSTLEELSKQSKLKKLLWRNDVACHIVAAYKDLNAAVLSFNVSVQFFRN